MDVLTAQLVVLAVCFVGILVWLTALMKFRKLNQLHTNLHIVQKVPVLAEDTRHNILAAIVARPQIPSHTTPVIDVLKRDANHIQLSLNESVAVDLELDEQYDGTEVTASCDFTAAHRKWMLLLGQYIVFIMPAIILGLGAFLFFKVAPAGNPAIRWQVVQAVQIVHFLWPPFLFIALLRQKNRAVMRTVDQLLMAAEIQSGPPTELPAEH